MYDVLRSRYTFACPTRGETHVALSAFRRLVRLPGAAHPALYQVEFDCGCGDDARRPRRRRRPRLGAARSRRRHVPEPDDVDGYDSLAGELAEVSAQRIKAGEWPWSFFCYPEERPRPGVPVVVLAARAGRQSALGVAVRCPVCSRVSVNLVSPEHIDLPFHNDAHVGVVEHVFARGRRARRSRSSARSSIRRRSTTAGSRWSNRRRRPSVLSLPEPTRR